MGALAAERKRYLDCARVVFVRDCFTYQPEPVLRTFTAVIERDQETSLLVGYIPGWPGAHSQGATLDELHANLREVVDMLLEDGEPTLDAEFVGTQTLEVA